MENYELTAKRAYEAAETGRDGVLANLISGMSADDLIHAMGCLVQLGACIGHIVDKVSDCMTQALLTQEHIDIRRYDSLDSAMRAATDFINRQADRVGTELTIAEFDVMCRNINSTLELYFQHEGNRKSLFRKIFGR